MKRLLKYLLKVCLTIAALSFLVLGVGWSEITHSLGEARPLWLVCMYLFNFCVRIIEAWQMKILLYKAGASLTVARVFLANALSALYALIVPGDLIASGAKWASLASATGRKSVVLNAILYNRFAIMMPAIVFGTMAIVYENPFPQTMLRGSAVLFGLLTLLIVGVLYHPRLGASLDQACGRLCRGFPAPIREVADRIAKPLQDIRAFSVVNHLTFVALSSISLVISLCMFACGVKAMGLNVPIATLVWTYGLLMLLRQIPITVSNLGVRESVLIIVLGRYGVPPEVAFTLGLILFTNHVIFAIVGAGYQIRLNLGGSQCNTRLG